MTNFEKITKDEDALVDFILNLNSGDGCPPYEDKALQLCIEKPKGEITCVDCWFRWLDQEAKVEP